MPDESHITTNNRDAAIVRTSIIGIVANVLLAAFKAIVGVLSNSIAIVLDAVNNLSDAASSIITIVGTKLAGKKPDREHPFGHGRTEYITTVVIAAIVLWAGVTSLQESVDRILNPQVASYDTVTLVIVAVAVVAKIVLGRYVSGQGRKANSDSLIASGKDATLDAVISASTLVAAFVYIFGNMSLEAWLGAVISLIIIKAGVDILRESVSKIIGERVDPELAHAVRDEISQVEGVNGAYDLLMEDYGPDRLWGSVHVEVDDTTTAAQIDRMTREIQQRVMTKTGVLLHTVGVYSSNTGSEGLAIMRKDLMDYALEQDHVLEVHGFYVDEANKQVTFDVVVDFDAPDRRAVVNAIRDEAARRYPDYTFMVALDSDISG